MGLFDELKKLTQPQDDDGDFFDGADDSFKPAPPAAAASSAQLQFESTFGEEPSANPEPARRQTKAQGEGGNLFGNLGSKMGAKPRAQRERVVNFGGSETHVILFNPRSFQEAGELVGHLQQGRSVVMSLEGVSSEMARRLLDFLSGITFAMQGKITPISGKGYFVSPQNVDLLKSQGEQPVSDGKYF